MSNPTIETLEPRRLLDATIDAALLTSADVQIILAQAASQARPAKPTQAIVVVDRFGNLLGEFDEKGLTTATPGITSAMISEIDLDALLRAKTAALFESDQNAFSTRTARFIIQDHFPEPITDTPGGPLYGVQFSSAEGSDVEIPNSALAASLNPAGLSGDPGGFPLYKGAFVSGKKVMEAVGAIGVAGDFSDTAARADLLLTTPYATAANPKKKIFNGGENSDFDESVALAGALHYMAPPIIRASNIFIDGLRTPFAASPRAAAHRTLSYSQILAQGAGTVIATPIDATPDPEPAASFDNYPGILSRQDFRANPTAAGQNYAPVASNDTAATSLTVDDVNKVITDAVKEALSIRAGIRNPIGAHADVYVSVVDRDGDLLGSFGMNDATPFSYDVSVQKARTAAFFSDDTHAFSTRAIGFLAQRYLPPGISSSGTGGLFGVQNQLKFADVSSADTIIDDTLRAVGTVAAAANPIAGPVSVTAASGQTFSVGQIVTFGADTAHEYLITAATSTTITLQPDSIDTSLTPAPALTAGETILPKNPLKDGITIFPGGVPLYKNGVLVGAVGISGDGVDQDDIISFNAATGFSAPNGTRSDQLDKSAIPTYLASKVQTLENTFILGSALPAVQGYDPQIADIEQRIADGLRHLRLPYVKFPRNPEI